MQLQRTIGNRAVGKLLSEIGLIPSKAKQVLPVQRQEIPEEEEPLQGKFETIQRQEIPEEEEPLQGKFETIQRQEIPEEEEPLQGKFENKHEQDACPSCSAPLIQKQEENRTGMPDNLKAGVESLSGIDMSDVRVHYNSSKPAEVGALAYTQGTDIHVASGQERHLPHEGWHVVQQMQGRVKPTIQVRGVAINDNTTMEHEADVMGAKALANSTLPRRMESEDLAGVPQRLQRFFGRNDVSDEADVMGRKVLQHYAQSSSVFNTSAILQFVTEEEVATSLRNVRKYSPDMYNHYGEETIKTVLRANDLRVRGHASGTSGDAQNTATTEDLHVLREALSRYTPPATEVAFSVHSKSTGKRHSEKQSEEVHAQRENEKKDKKARRKEDYEAARKANFGKRPRRGGGGGSSFITQTKSSIPIRQEIGETVQRTIYDDEIGTLVWTPAFDQKHFAESPETAVQKGLARLRQSALKEEGARPGSNTVIIYDKDLLFWLKETILKHQIKGNFSFKAKLALNISGQGITLIEGATFNVGVNDENQIEHLDSVTGGTLKQYNSPNRTVKF